MDLTLAIECYNDKENSIKKLQLEKDVLESSILNEVNSKLSMNRVIANFSEKDFEEQINSMLSSHKISKVNRTTRLGKYWAETDITFDFYLNNLKYEIKFPITYTNIEYIDLHTLGMFEISLYITESSTLTIDYVNNFVELTKLLKDCVNLTLEEIAILYTKKLQERNIV